METNFLPYTFVEAIRKSDAMGNCGSSLNCGQCYSASGEDGCLTEIDVNPDIAGIGTLVAFLSSAFITCIAVFWGYVTYSLPSSVLSEADKSAIQWYQESFLARKLFPSIGRRWLSIPREQRVEAITRFVLALSDQQLVTGIAVITAALSNMCTITLFEFRIVSCLAWFSATTHLATLEVLSEYMLGHPVVRNCRIILIFIFLALLGFVQLTMVVSGDFIATSVPTFNQASILQCVFATKISGSITTLGILKIMIYIYILMRYTRSVKKFYKDLYAKVFRYFPCLPKKSDHGIPNTQLLHLPETRNVDEVVSSHHWAFSLLSYLHSFLSTLAQILFTLASGGAQVVAAIWFKGAKVSNGITRWGFGQVTALTLLALPGLVAVEIFNEERVSAQSDSSNASGGARETQAPESGHVSPPVNPAASQEPHSSRPLSISNHQSSNTSDPHGRSNIPISRRAAGKYIRYIFTLDSALFIIAGILYPIGSLPTVAISMSCLFVLFGLRGLGSIILERSQWRLRRRMRRRRLAGLNSNNSVRLEQVQPPPPTTTSNETNSGNQVLHGASTGPTLDSRPAGTGIRRQTV